MTNRIALKLPHELVAQHFPSTLPIWSDHVHHTWVDMRTGQPMSKRLYGDDLAQ